MGHSNLYMYMYQVKNDGKHLCKKGIIPWVGNMCGCGIKLVEVWVHLQ